MSFLDKFKKTNNIEDDDEKLNQDYQEILNEQKESHKRALEEAQKVSELRKEHETTISNIMNGRDAQIVNNRINNIIEETNKEESNVEDEIPVLSFDEIKEVSYFDTIIKKIEQKLRTLDSQPSDKQDALRSMIPIIDYWNQSSLYEKGRLMKDLKILSIPEIYTYITNGKYNDKQDQIIR